jgi:hypothetical protein
MSNTYISTPTWTLTNPSSPNFYQIITNETGTNLVGTDGDYIYKSSDRGVTFSNAVYLKTQSNIISSIAANSSLKFVVATATEISIDGNYVPGFIYRSTNYGATFTPLRNSPQAVWQTITSDATGKYLVAGQSDPSFLKLYYSTNSGATWKQCSGTNDSYWTFVKSSSNGSKVYALGKNRQTNKTHIYISSDYGEHFTDMGIISSTVRYFNQLSCNSTGQYLFATTNSEGVYSSSDYGVTWIVLNLNIDNGERYYGVSVSSTGQYVLITETTTTSIFFSTDYGNTWTLQILPGSEQGTRNYSLAISTNSLTMYSHIRVVGLYITQNSYPSAPGPTGPTGPAPGPTGPPTPGPTGTTPGPAPTGQTGQSTIPCFKEGTLILTDRGYIPVQELHKGDLVKTFKNDFLPIDMIGVREIYHKCSDERVKDQLYRLSKEKYKTLTEDLILTGCHAILVDCYRTKEQREKTIEINGDTYVTDNKYRLPACADEKAVVYEIPGVYNIYHLALENDDYYMNYGIYANGLLVESSSKRYMKELSGMALIE